jgi:glycosyltransferase involved in cell wall biosynthesis
MSSIRNLPPSLFEESFGDRLPVVYPPIDIDGRRFATEDITRRNTITFFSRFIQYKRPEMVLQLAAHYPDHPFLLMGAVNKQRWSYFNSLKHQAEKEGLTNVRFLANPPNEVVRAELAKTRFYVFPAVNEHFGMTTVEAIASGTIPFVHNSGGQIESVPIEKLRFSDEDFFGKFHHALNIKPDELNQIRSQLLEHIQQFSEEEYINAMLSYLPQPTEQVVRKAMATH